MAKTKEALRLQRIIALRAVRASRMSALRAEIIDERVCAARNDLDLIASTRESIISLSKKVRCSRREFSQIAEEAALAYVKTLFKEVLRRPRKKPCA